MRASLLLSLIFRFITPTPNWPEMTIPPHSITSNTSPELSNGNAANYHFVWLILHMQKLYLSYEHMSIIIDHFRQLIYMFFFNCLLFWYQALYANNELRYEYGIKYMAWDDNSRRNSFFDITIFISRLIGQTKTLKSLVEVGNQR